MKQFTTCFREVAKNLILGCLKLKKSLICLKGTSITFLQGSIIFKLPKQIEKKLEIYKKKNLENKLEIYKNLEIKLEIYKNLEN